MGSVRKLAAWVFIWDFDDTIVDGNSDTYPFQELAPDVLRDVICNRAEGKDWTAKMDDAFACLPALGVSPNNLLKSVANMSIPSDTIEALKNIHIQPDAIQCIVSDANTLFISAILSKAHLSDAFQGGIFTNPAGISGEHPKKRIVLNPFCPTSRPPHTCANCPANMCKGALVEDIMAQHPHARFAYVGDGSNDLCGSRRLPSGSYILPRAGFRLAQKLQGTPVKAKVVPWENPSRLLESIRLILS